MTLQEIDAYYDTVPRVAATVEEVGPFTLFLSVPGTGWDFYARPRLGHQHDFTAEDVRRVLARQEELKMTRAIEWVHEVTPALLPAVREVVGADAELEECPLLSLPADRSLQGEDPPGTHRVLTSDDAEMMGIGVLPMARKQGRGGAITRALVQAARSRGVSTAFLSAGSDEAASVYRAVGFERVGTACILKVPGLEVQGG